MQCRQQPAIYASEQVCIGWHRTGACYTDKLTFSHSSSVKVLGVYYTNVRIIFEFLRYVECEVLVFVCCSMGGHGALICHLKNPGMYKSVSAMAPICNPSQCPWGLKAFEGYLGSDRTSWAVRTSSVSICY